jgi:hypothetical protein
MNEINLRNRTVENIWDVRIINRTTCKELGRIKTIKYKSVVN